MGPRPKITKIELVLFQYKLENMGPDPSGFQIIYAPGKTATRRAYALKVSTDLGIAGEFVGHGTAETATLPMFADWLIGKNPLERDELYADMKHATRQISRIGIAPVDNALWDLAGKYYNAPVYELLGGKKKRLPAYASTTRGDNAGVLTTPEDYADFAERCYEIGYRAFKIHPWAGVPIEQHVAVVHALGKRVGGKMDLMIDPFCYYKTFADALKVGRACDEENFFWIEDPYADGGISQFGHRRLRQLIKTPVLQTEMVRSLEPHVDFILADATDFVRGDPTYDGITGTMKIAHAAEGLGVDIELHGAGPAQRACMAAIRNTNYYEMGLVNPKAPFGAPPVYKDGYRDGLDAVGKDGCVDVPDGPGLGAPLDWAFINKNQVGKLTFE